ncbi:MAG: iron ABC transporter permease [Rhodospirillaceae bacterium]|nr:iron ABC transporter permease [Rhodospirillaceae bacterium]|tara:strand:+ start:1668 stop:3344 length:1677 start_codon:yes stop_codon:yes gene_type:complete
MSATAPRRRLPVSGTTLLTIGTLALATLVALPILAVALNLFADSGGLWGELAATVLPTYLINTVALLIGVGLLAGAMGTGAAWLVSMCEFPGRRVFEWALLLPFAAPAYVLAYVYTDLLEFAGPIQTFLRDLFGWTRHDYWFPAIRSTPGAIVMLSLVVYPYVYLLGRAAFVSQSVAALEVSRTLGHGPWSSFFRVALPLARPGVAAGLALALMETLADFGTVEFFGVRTFTTGIYRTWFLRGSSEVAAQLASILMIFVVAVMVLEHSSRGKARFASNTGRFLPLPRHQLKGLKATIAITACALPVFFGFALPGAILLDLTLTKGDPLLGGAFLGFVGNSVMAAGLAAMLAVAAAMILGYGARMVTSPTPRIAARMASMGYAIPGSVIAVGVLIPLAWFDNSLDRFMRDTFDVSTGLLLTGSIAALLFAYVVRFLAVAYNAVDAGLTKVTPSMDGVARTLGHGLGSTLARIHVPLLRGSLLSGALLVFVDVMKELPATLIIRPFNFETLATRVYRLAADERLAEASTAALAIVVVGVVPVLVLSRAIARSRPGDDQAP